jgi:hypothetical protein
MPLVLGLFVISIDFIYNDGSEDSLLFAFGVTGVTGLTTPAQQSGFSALFALCATILAR